MKEREKSIALRNFPALESPGLWASHKQHRRIEAKRKKKTKKAQENKTEQTNAFIDPGIIGIIERTNVLT